jgi:hypothetical protein
MKTKVGLEWYQTPALSLLFIRLYFFSFEGTFSFKVDKTGFRCKYYAGKLCRINVAPAANSKLQCANFNDLIYTNKPICSMSNPKSSLFATDL